MEIKYTTDWKKVVVIWNLNSTDKIVQEIFIIDWSEIPSWEHFIVKSLHNELAVSWKEQKIKDIEEEYEKKHKEYTEKTKYLNTLYKNKTDELSKLIEYCWENLKNINENTFDTLINVLTWKIKYIVVDCYRPELIKYNDFFSTYNSDWLAILSLFWRDKWDLHYRLNRYSDWSWPDKNIYLFTDYNEALICFKEIIIKSNINENILKIAKEFNIKLDENKLKEYIKLKTNEADKYIKNYMEHIIEYEKQKDELLKLNNNYEQ